MLRPCEAKRDKVREIGAGGLCPALRDNLKAKPLQRERNMKKTSFVIMAAIVVFLAALWVSAAAAASVPQVASAMGREMDRQLSRRFGQTEAGSLKSLSLCITTPMDINALEQSNPLARQMQEELARWFVQAGYPVLEIRKGRDLLFEPSTGEMLLTREEKLLGNAKVTSAAIVAGTYTVTPENVRFNINIVSTGSREVLAMSTLTVPMTPEVAALTGRGAAGNAVDGMPIEPNVVTLLP